MDLRLLLASSAVLLTASITSITSITSTSSITVETGGTSQCKVKWLFGILCQDVSVKLVNQIKTWQIGQSCQYTGERCSYELVSAGQYQIKATHTDPTTKKLNELDFLLEQSTVCKVTGEAATEASNDPAGSSNFCSLQNLMNGSDLIHAEGYKQFSNKWICPGFDTANCSLS
ncbi:uncharacterized protein wu:fc46h12 [Antennarius striatus]|uniref:uncharacterized protein wu:fc46h12 n=1 Tax=Antennarius striatus TaxID=241820 RepID=UPI0035B43D1E